MEQILRSCLDSIGEKLREMRFVVPSLESQMPHQQSGQLEPSGSEVNDFSYQ
jgi:hypothetical protein